MMPNVSRGRSFKGVTAYLTHDKRGPGVEAVSSERVGFSQVLNFTAGEARNPEEAAHVMAATWRGADALKAAAGIKSTGRKATAAPVWHCSLSWHPTEAPTESEMREAALAALKAAGLELDQGYQTVVIQHTDEPHPHLHIVVNLVHPITGKQTNPHRDLPKLQAWADAYDRGRGHNFAKDRRAKQDALARREKIPARQIENPRSRTEWQARKAANEDRFGRAREEAAALRSTYAARVAALGQASRDDYGRRRTAFAALKSDYEQRREEIKAKYRPHLDAVLKHRRDRNALPLSPQGFRDWRESREWKALSRRLWSQRHAFGQREGSMTGRLRNAFVLSIKAGQSQPGGRAGAFLRLMGDPGMRAAFFEGYQQAAKKALSEKHFQQKVRRADPIRLAMNAELAASARDYKARAAALKGEAARAKETQQEAWRALSQERNQDWTQWRERFDIPERKTAPAPEGQGGPLSDAFKEPRPPSPARDDPRSPREALNQAAGPPTDAERRATEQARRDERRSREEERWKLRSKDRKRDREGPER